MALNDIALFSVIFGSVAVAVTAPALGGIFHPYLLYCMMMMLFLSFLKIDFSALLDTSPTMFLQLAALATVKLVVLPVALYWATLAVLPDYAVPVLLLSGISTGVVAPFIATLVSANVAPVLRMVVVTSVLVPFSLPCLVKVLAGAEISIPLDAMMRLLAMVIFLPLVAVLLLRRVCPGLLEKLQSMQFPISLVFFGVINLGVFSKYSEFFLKYPGQVLACVGVAYALSVIYYAAGFLLTPRRELPERLAACVSFAVMNNVLVIVFASEFFGPLSPTLAAMYMFPFFTMIVPVKILSNRPEPETRREPQVL